MADDKKKNRFGPDPFRNISFAVIPNDRDYDKDDSEEYHGSVIYIRKVMRNDNEV